MRRLPTECVYLEVRAECEIVVGKYFHFVDEVGQLLYVVYEELNYERPTCDMGTRGDE